MKMKGIRMARPRKKPGYDAEKVRNDFFQEVAECYKESSKVSLRDVAAEFDITLLKVRKVLITAGVCRKKNVKKWMM